jgi:cell division GTPase FtsZ
MSVRTQLTRRSFIQSPGAGLTAAAAPLLLPSRVCAAGPEAPSNRFNIGLIGCGGRGNDIVREALGNGANVIALCDADAARLAVSRSARPNSGR